MVLRFGVTVAIIAETAVVSRHQNLITSIWSGHLYTVIRKPMAINAYFQTVARMIALSVIWLSPAAVLAAAPASVLAFDATYTVRYGILRGTMTLQLSRQDTDYLYETSLSPRGVASWIRHGSISERTVLESLDGTVRPLEYTSTDTIANPVRNTRYFFDQKAGQVTGQYKTQLIDVPMRTGGHNRISAHVAIMLALKSNTEISEFPIFDRGRWKDYEFEIAGEQAVKTPSGHFDTVEIRYASADNKKSWSLYCATTLDYLPVMIVYREGGKVKSRAQLTDYRIGEQGPSE